MARKGPEYELQQQIVGTGGLAVIFGWEHVHFRPLLTRGGVWRTPGSGTMARGWPDLTLVRQRDRRLIFAELKSDQGRLTDDEKRVLDVLRSLEGRWVDPALLPESPYAGMSIEVHVWRPKEFDRIVEAMR